MQSVSMPRRRVAARTVALAAALALPASAASAADEPWPSRPITIVVPFGTGSGSDTGARLLAKDLDEALGQPVVVENRPGANGAIGAQLVARAKPDGYTLLFGSATTNATNFAFFPGKLAYAPGDFEVVSPMGGTPQVLWVPETEPASNLADLVARLKREPGRTNCGSGNAVTQVACEILKKQGGFEAATISYKSNSHSVADVATGQITMAFSDTTAALPYVEQRKVRPIAVAGEQRSPVFPQVPTFREQGYADIVMTAWSGLFAPRGTPAPVLEKLSAAVKRANDATPSVESRRRSGSFDLWRPLPEARAFVASEIARWERYVRDSGVKPQ
ncbi:MAG TPA: tripartite tricarboxylate transporter substrate binding protein [Burkholderiaceae bacterium]|nr:tripartite tricarboxylate transporter substrate binding protein [Burkholderiaceae bacterium]